MLRKVYLEGELGALFGTEFTIFSKQLSDIFKCLDTNLDGKVRKYLIDAADRGVNFTFDVNGFGVTEEEELLMPLKDGDVIITPVPAGSKGGAGKILVGALIVGAVLIAGPASITSVAGVTAEGLATVTTTATWSAGQLALFGLAANLALTGLQQLMAPDPSVDDPGGQEDYIYSGTDQAYLEGDPIPLVYGRIRVPGRPISYNVSNRINLGSETSGSGSIILPDGTVYEGSPITSGEGGFYVPFG